MEISAALARIWYRKEFGTAKPIISQLTSVPGNQGLYLRFNCHNRLRYHGKCQWKRKEIGMGLLECVSTDAISHSCTFPSIHNDKAILAEIEK